MSITPQAIERSVLENKERDELAAIAEAMGIKASARASKSTLIDHILREAGIETAEERPKRTRRSSSSGAPATAGNGATTSEPDEIEIAATTEAPSDPGPDVTDAVGTDAPEVVTDQMVSAAGVDGSGNGVEAPAEQSLESSDFDAGHQAQQLQQGHQDSPRSFTDDRAQEQTGRREDRSGPNSAPLGNGPMANTQGGQMIEAGNRRGRRRRGRDRGERDVSDRGPGPDLQYQGEPIPAEGLLDLREEGYGFLRTSGFLAGPRDVYVSLSQVRRFALRKGDVIQGGSRPAGSSEKYPALVRIDTINGVTPEEARQRPKFEDLTPLFPDQKLRLEIPGEPTNMVARIVDLISPIGKGQRGLIVSPPKAGKTTVLKQIAHSIEVNNPEVHLMVLLVDERPEEVTDMRRSVKGEVVASTFDRPSDEHTQVAELALERAKRMVEVGKDVVIVLDGITRL
ncbi:MAG TPA: transcription termination factor Rho, partial [Acidimicrobiales bacterium]